MAKVADGLTNAMAIAFQPFVLVNGQRQAPFGSNGTVGEGSEGDGVLLLATLSTWW